MLFLVCKIKKIYKQIKKPFTTISLNKNREKKKVTKKGIILTTLIIIGIVGASFIVYLIP